MNYKALFKFSALFNVTVGSKMEAINWRIDDLQLRREVCTGHRGLKSCHLQSQDSKTWVCLGSSRNRMTIEEKWEQI